ncbi:MAG: peptidoglycan-associated lipoprotein Pal [Pseudomonadota bacterium]
MKKIVLLISASCILAACAGPKTNTQSGPFTPSSDAANSAATATRATTPPDPSASANGLAGSANTSPIASDPLLNDRKSILAKRSVYYAVDVAVVQDSDKPVIMAHAQYLKEHPGRVMRIEGNCDERGSTEYNLALGQRRADAVKSMLEAGGARENQIQTVSYGETKPKSPGHDETAWKQNRRADLVYLR